jgi:hypothetical protein
MIFFPLKEYRNGRFDPNVLSLFLFFRFRCLCDSSWPVGLGANETQEPEYFGPNCALRHCPTGDDPVTLDKNELNCTNVTARGGRGVGMPGNKCHVDCSNRGICDYVTGMCECFNGFFGANCGTPESAFVLGRETLRDYVNNDNIGESLAEIRAINEDGGWQ